MTKKEDYKNNPEPSYYSGTKYGYSARKVVEDFDLSYNVGTACSYLMRAGKKEETIELVTWKQVVKRYNYKDSKNKGTRFGIQIRLEGMNDIDFIWCQTNLERKKLVKTIMRIAKEEGRNLKLID